MEISFEIKETLGLKDYLIKYYSFSFFGYLKETRAKIFDNGKSIKLNDTVLKGDKILINYIPLKQEGNLSDKPLKIVYENENCIVVDKESGVPTIPSRLHQDDTLFNRLKFYFKNTENTIHFISRLDKDTSGLVLVCKNQFAACEFSKYQDQFIKEYIAETYNEMPNKHGVIELPIDRLDGIKRCVNNNGKYAKTEYKLLSSSEGIFRYKVRLYTGLTHQIRVHFAYFNCPLINDKIYSLKSNNDGPMHLYANYLKFYDPFLDKWLEIKTEKV